MIPIWAVFDVNLCESMYVSSLEASITYHCHPFPTHLKETRRFRVVKASNPTSKPGLGPIETKPNVRRVSCQPSDLFIRVSPFVGDVCYFLGVGGISCQMHLLVQQQNWWR